MHVDIRQAAKSTAVCGAMTHHVASAFVKAHIVSGRALQPNVRENLQTVRHRARISTDVHSWMDAQSHRRCSTLHVALYILYERRIV